MSQYQVISTLVVYLAIGNAIAMFNFVLDGIPDNLDQTTLPRQKEVKTFFWNVFLRPPVLFGTFVYGLFLATLKPFGVFVDHLYENRLNLRPWECKVEEALKSDWDVLAFKSLQELILKGEQKAIRAGYTVDRMAMEDLIDRIDREIERRSAGDEDDECS